MPARIGAYRRVSARIGAYRRVSARRDVVLLTLRQTNGVTYLWPDNAFVESFNGKFRAECLSTHWFVTMNEARTEIELWRKEYNTERPHSSWGLKTPTEFAEKWQSKEAV